MDLWQGSHLCVPHSCLRNKDNTAGWNEALFSAPLYKASLSRTQVFGFLFSHFSLGLPLCTFTQHDPSPTFLPDCFCQRVSLSFSCPHWKPLWLTSQSHPSSQRGQIFEQVTGSGSLESVQKHACLIWDGSTYIYHNALDYVTFYGGNLSHDNIKNVFQEETLRTLLIPLGLSNV